jgi:hypothetical protein
LYSVVGRVMKDDILWLTSEANSLDSITYGRQGSVLHYFKLSPYLLGVPLVLLVLAGLGWLLLRLRGKTAGAGADGELRVTALLMTGSFCALFVTYVAIWSLGIFDVIGDARHIARTGAGGGRHRDARSSLGPGLPRAAQSAEGGLRGRALLAGPLYSVYRLGGSGSAWARRAS